MKNLLAMSHPSRFIKSLLSILVLTCLLSTGRVFAKQQPSRQDSLLERAASSPSEAPSIFNALAVDYLRTDFALSRAFADSAFAAASRTSNVKEAINSLVNKGTSFYYAGEHDFAMELYVQALEFADSINDPSLQARALNEMGGLQRKQGDLDLAKQTLTKALELSRLANDSGSIANSMNNLGVVYDMLEQYSEAMALYEESAEIKKQIGDTYGLTFNLDNMGQVASKIGEFDKGEAYLKEAARLREELGDQTGYAITINNIGELYMMKGDEKTALEYFEKALSIAEKLDYKDFRRHLYMVISDTYKNQGNYPAALNYLSKFSVLKDSIYNEQRSKQILELQTKYETEKKEQEIQIRDLKLAEQELYIQQKNLQLYSSVGGLGVLLILLYLAYNRLQLQKRVQELELVQKMQGERERISSDLHDHVGAQLTSILSGLQITDQIEGFKKDAEVRQIISSLKDDARETLTSLRDSIWSLNQSEISVTEFAEHIERYLHTALKYLPTCSFQIENKTTGDFTLASIEALNLTRTLQESVQNIVKHAKASQIKIVIDKQEKLTMEVTDNGVGFDQSPSSSSEHYGISNMKRRMAEIGGTLTVISSSGNGTRVILTL